MNSNNNNEEKTKYLVILDENGEVQEVMEDDPLYDGGFQDPEEDDNVYHIEATDPEKAGDTAMYLDKFGKYD